MTYALRVTLEPQELRPQHALELVLFSGDPKERLAGLRVAFQVQDMAAYTEEASLGAPIPLDVFEIPEPGHYFLRATFDEHELGMYRLLIEGVGAPEQPEAPEQLGPAEQVDEPEQP
jgi:hypothetical protein